MKQLIYSAIFLIISQGAFALEMPEIVGEWHVTSLNEDEDGFAYKTNERVIYKKDGSYYADGTVIILQSETNERVLTVSGPESGTWTVKGNEVHVHLTKIEIDFFSSSSPEISRDTMLKEMEEALKEPVITVFVSKDNNKFVFKDKEDGTEQIMTKLSDLPEDGRPVAEVLGTFTFKELGGDPTVKTDVKKDPAGERMRRTSLSVLKSDGFTASSGLPTFKRRKGIGGDLRPRDEILTRLLCNYAVVSWVVFPEKTISSKSLLKFVENYGLSKKMTDTEKDIIATGREDASEKFRGTIGWKMENMWALAWVLGFDLVPDVDQGQIGEETISSLWEFLAPAWKGKDELLKGINLRPLREIAQLEDIFYCAHNAVRAAQTGNSKAVPEGFHSIVHGGTVHEKRHSLTWVLSPDVKWADTDLST